MLAAAIAALLAQIVTEGEELRLETPVSGEVAEGIEAAWHLVAPEDGWVYAATATTEDAAFEPVLELHPRNRSGPLVRVEDWRDHGVRLEWLAAEGATYWVRVSSFYGGPGSYRLALSRAQVARPSWQEPLVGEITHEDRSRWYALDAQAGWVYDWTAARDTLGDPYLELYTPAMRLLAEDDDSGEDFCARLVWAPARNGTVLLKVRAAVSDVFGTYRLTPAFREAQEGDSPARPRPIELGETGSARIDGRLMTHGPGQWFRVALAAGRTYRIDAVGETLEDPLLEVYDDAADRLLADDDDGARPEGRDARLEWCPQIEGRYLLRVRSYQIDQGGTFHLTLSEVSP